MELTYDVVNIVHYPKRVHINETQIKALGDPLVIIQSDDLHNGEHTQIRVIPFNKDNVAKEELSFNEKAQFFKKTVRPSRKKPQQVQVELADTTVCSYFVSNYFNSQDGFQDEFNEFMNGFNTRPVTGYENDILGFFADNYLDLPNGMLAEVYEGLMTS